MNCEKYLELLSARLDGALSESEEQELEKHLASCPDCRAAGAQLAALRPAFAELEDIPAPEGFAQNVMDRIREENKAVPLFRRPWLKTLAGLAACAVLAAGLYGVVCPPQRDGDLMIHDYHQNALKENVDVSAGETLRSVPDVSLTDAGPDTDTPSVESGNPSYERQINVPDTTAVYDSAAGVLAVPIAGTEILVVDHMPEGGWDLIPPETPVSADGLHVTGELLEQIEHLAQEQGITASLTSGMEEAEEHLLVVLEGTE